MLPASIAPSALPAPTMVCNSSINRIICPSCLLRSLSTAFNRSSNSPRNLAPAISEPISSDSTRLFFKPSGTSPLIIRCARPSTIAVLPTPGSPISTGLFLVRRCNTWIARRISSSRPITGSSLPCSARSVKSTVYFSSAMRWSSALASFTGWPPRMASTAAEIDFLLAPADNRASFSGPLSSITASTNSSLEMNWSLRSWASLSVTLSSLPRALEICTSPAVPSTLTCLSSNSPSCDRSRLILIPAWVNNGRTDPPCWSSKAVIKCTGSMNWWSRPTAKDCASARAS